MTRLEKILKDLLEDSREAIPGPRPGRVHLMPGADVVWDDCCDGQVWTRVISVTPNRGKGPCSVVSWTAEVAVGAVRCAATVDNRGNPPSPKAMTADTVAMLDDMHALEHVVQCSPHVSRIGGWRPIGPQGGCLGGEWTVNVRYGSCECEEGDDG